MLLMSQITITNAGVIALKQCQWDIIVVLKLKKKEYAFKSPIGITFQNIQDIWKGSQV